MLNLDQKLSVFMTRAKWEILSIFQAWRARIFDSDWDLMEKAQRNRIEITEELPIVKKI